MQIKVLYGETISSYEYKEDGNMAPFSHQICFSNELKEKQKKSVRCGEPSGFMGCCWIRGLESLTRKECISIFKDISEKFGTHVYGENSEEMLQAIKERMNALCIYIKNNSPKPLSRVFWESGLKIHQYKVFFNEESS